MEIKRAVSLNGSVTVPGDKSISHRAVMLGALAEGTTHIKGFLPGADCISTINCFRSMGIEIQSNGDIIEVHGKGLYGLKQPEKMLYTGNSGTTTRLLCGILSGQSFDSSVTGDASICRRPMKRVTEPLSEMGAKIDGEYCPLFIKGSRLHGMEYNMKVASAQVKTAIILAALYADGETIIHETEKSRDHTERMLSAMGADISVNGTAIRVAPAKKLYSQDICVPGDISSAAFFMTAAAIMPDSCVRIKNAGINPTRTGIIDVFKSMGARISIENVRTESGEETADIVVSSSSLKGTVIEGEMIPRLIDELPIIAVAALFAEGTTVIRNAEELKVKESNRISAIVGELSKCGADITETADGMIIKGGKPIFGADFVTRGDHRMAMSLAVLAQLADGKSTIDDADCISVSYPNFLDDFYGLGQV